MNATPSEHASNSPVMRGGSVASGIENQPSQRFAQRGNSQEQQTAAIILAEQDVVFDLIDAQDIEFKGEVKYHPILNWDVVTVNKDTYGAVVLHVDTPDLLEKLKIIQSQAPLISILLVTQEAIGKDHHAAKLLDIDWLHVPAVTLEWQARLNRAIEFSHAKYMLNQSHQMDEDTRVYNYSYFLKRLNEKLALSRRHQFPTSVVVLDIAFYNVFVDSYGYSFVSAMLNQVADTVVDTVRGEDIVARLGNSEICILLPYCTAEGALELSKRLVQKLESLQFHNGDQVEHIHLTAGIASYPMANDMDVNADGLIRYARHAVHQAKMKGEQDDVSEEDEPTIEIFNTLKPQVS